MRTFSAQVEWDPDTKLYVGIVPGIPGAQIQGATLDELHRNLKEVLELRHALAHAWHSLQCMRTIRLFVRPKLTPTASASGAEPSNRPKSRMR